MPYADAHVLVVELLGCSLRDTLHWCTNALTSSPVDRARMGDWRVVRVRTAEERWEALDVRHEVFVDEQGVSIDRERDEYDDYATHFVAYDGSHPVGAARLRPYEDGSEIGKIERVAVRAERRGEGWGRKIMAAVETTAREEGFTTLRLDSQNDAIGFYERLGYEVMSESFMDAGIPHRTMILSLD